MRNQKAMAGALALAGGLMVACSWSQPAGDAGKAANPPAAKTEKQQIADILAKSQQTALDVMNMTPEQQAQWMQKMQFDSLRLTLANTGFDDLELQENLQRFLVQREQSRRPLRVTSALLYLASEKEGIKLSDAQFEALLKRYETQVAAQKAREAGALDKLDDKIQWKARPRLRAVLLQNGVIGDAAWYTRSEMVSPSGTGVDLATVQFWNANQKLPPGVELPPAQ